MTVSQLFEEVAERYGDFIALVFENERLTYRELNARPIELPIDFVAWALVVRRWWGAASLVH